MGKSMNKGYDPNTGIWDINTAHKKHKLDPLLAGAIMTYYNQCISSVTDLGCGLGHYCKLYSTKWICVDGYEGTPGVWTSGFNHIFQVDLSASIIHRCFKYDLVTCLEVGEHIPKDKEQQFLDNVVSFVRYHLVLSWAIPGQKGTGHVNEQLNKYIINQIQQRGLKYNRKASEFLRLHSALPWFKNTLMVFKRKK